MPTLTDAPDRSEPTAGHHVLILHEVSDYGSWKAIFDAAAEMRKSAGERSYQVFRHQQDANRVVHLSVWSSHGRARQFFESPELEAVRRRAGVKAPEFHYLTQLESGSL